MRRWGARVKRASCCWSSASSTYCLRLPGAARWGWRPCTRAERGRSVWAAVSEPWFRAARPAFQARFLENEAFNSKEADARVAYYEREVVRAGTAHTHTHTTVQHAPRLTGVGGGCGHRA
jgi:hypothetical protein